MPTTSVMWFRRDLRLADNPALLAAGEADCVLPLFVIDPALWDHAGPARRAYLAASLRALADATDGALVVRHGDPRAVVPAVAREVSAGTVHRAADYGPYGKRRDAAVAEALAEHDIEDAPLGSPYAVAPGRVLNGSGQPYQVYSAYQRAWAEHGWRAPVDPPRRITWAKAETDDLPADDRDRTGLPDDFALPEAGERAARKKWFAFRDHRLEDYAQGRNMLADQGASGMSVHLKWGEIHPRTMLADLAGQRSKSVETYRKEVAWREFYADVLHHRPEAAREDYRSEFGRLGYDDPGPEVDAWRRGETGFPLVDAGMRELLATGSMHNRVRMVVASFLTKDLHVWWRHGARHFMEWLVDGDLASNQLNWQWVAGSGTDAAPYFRVFNPTTQSKKFDPDGSYIRRWVPELAHLSAPEIHEPQGVEGYPEPVVDHAEERAEALRRYENVKGD